MAGRGRLSSGLFTAVTLLVLGRKKRIRVICKGKKGKVVDNFVRGELQTFLHTEEAREVNEATIH